MTGVERDRIATPLVLAYWLTLVGGLVLFTTTRFDESTTVVALWVGALGGTMLGQFLALRDYRLWIVGLIVLLCALYGAPLVPAGAASTTMWRAFIPAVLCGFWSLGDRASIAACWFPATIWMLSILDRTGDRVAPDGVGVTLLVGLAVAVLAILRAHETRRVALWRMVGAVPLAAVQPAELLRESPVRQLARAGWGLSIGAIAVALTAWVAPRLWRIETLEGPHVQVASPSRQGLPCCPVGADAESTQARVKEYFDLGRGHGEHVGPPREGVDCQVCTDESAVVGTLRGATGPVQRVSVPPEAIREATGEIDEPGVIAGEVITGAGTDGEVTAGNAPAAPSQTGGVDSYAGESGGVRPVSPAIVAPQPPVVAPQAPPRVVAPPPVATTTTVSPPLATVRPKLSVNRAAPPPVAPPTAPARTSSSSPSLEILPLLMMLATAALMFQVIALGLRPLRRLITLRHLRRPFWDETVDQRVSNAWQLALVGLRDAGWRPGAQEAPQALARRVGVTELERCATILERARHGLGIDAEDLQVMRSSADAAYAAARRGLGPLARAVGWIRWPLT